MNDAFDSWSNTARWIAFLPMFFLAYLFAYYSGRWALFWSFGMFGINEHNIVGFIIYHFYQNFGCIAIAMVVSASCAPKGKIIVGSVYLGIILMMIGFSTFSLITYGDPSGLKPWQSIYDYILNLAAGILALVGIISTESDKRKSIMDKVAEALAQKRLDNEEKMKDPEYARREALIKEKLGL